MLFGKLAIHEKMITPQQLERALAIQQEKKDWLLGEILAFLGYLTDRQIKQLLHTQQQIADNRSVFETRSNVLEDYSPNGETHVGDQAIDHTVTRDLDLRQKLDKKTYRHFGRYQVLNEIGCGGMGRVYKAYDSELQRLVALKVLISGEAASPKENERFLREARATAQLRHPNIVTVYGSNNENGQNFFTMDFIEGVSLKTFLQKNTLTIRQIIEVMIKVGDAVHYAHTRKIIHRDIKPSNIMIDDDREPKIMDFGLAKMASVNDSLSKTGDVLGTPAYMSPEQVESKEVDITSDVYSLGATLYEALTGKPPFRGESYLDVLYQIVHKDPIPLRNLNPSIPLDLEAICLKCLEKNPNKRYSNALLFVQELKNFLAGRPIIAKPLNRLSHMKRFVLEHRVVRTITVLFFLAAVTAGIFCFVQWQKLKQEQVLLDHQGELLEKLQQKSSDAHLLLAQIALDKAKISYNHREWKMCCAYCGIALEFIRETEDLQKEHLREEIRSFLYASLDQLSIAPPRKGIQEDPQKTIEELLQLEITKTLSVRYLGDK